MIQPKHPAEENLGEGRDIFSRKVSGFKKKLYSRIHVSVRTMDRIIAALFLLLAAAVIIGIATGGR